MSAGKAAGYLFAGVLAGVLVGMAVQAAQAAGRPADPADLPPDGRSDAEQATAVPPRYTPVRLASTPPVHLVNTPPVTPGDTFAFPQVAQGVPGVDTLAERYPAYQPDPATVPALGTLRPAQIRRPVRVARYMMRRVRRFLTSIGPAAGAQALFLVALFAALWRRKRSAASWPVWLWIPPVLAAVGERVAIVRAELVAGVRCRPVRGPDAPGVCWPVAVGGCVT